MPKKITQAEFIARAKAIHPEYDYSKVVFVNMATPVTIHCPDHGDFLQRPSDHIKSSNPSGCQKCGKERQGQKTSLSDFIAKAREIHGNKYNYSKVSYVNAHTDVIIVCKKHDSEFLQRPDAHIHQKQGCKICGYQNRVIPHQGTTEKFIAAAKEKWNNDYSETVYVNKETKVRYYCYKHGWINQKPRSHIKHGCPYCNGRGISRHTNETFKAIASKIHETKYDYSLVNLRRITDYIEIICPKHGVFEQRANNHIHLMNGCPSCKTYTSKAEKAVLAFIKDIYTGEILENNRKLLGGKEIDIDLPDLKLAIEYHGMYWHTETVYGRKTHKEKADLAQKLGYQLIQIYSDEWENKQEIVKSKIRCLLGRARRIFARQCVLRELTAYEKNVFLDETHIQGRDGSTYAVGLLYNNEIVACMTFGTPRFSKKHDWELVRFSSARNTVVVGGAARLLKHFRDRNAGPIISYADRRWSVGGLYEKLGFELDGVSEPSFCYFHIASGKVYNRMKFQKKKLTVMPGYSEDLKEYEIMQMNGYDRVWDAGQYRFVLR